MKLASGQRLSSGRHACYLIGECLQTADRHQLYAGRKVFYNHRYAEKEFYEAAPDEWVDVLIRVCKQTPPSSASAVDSAGAQLCYEAYEVLAAHPEWFPQVLDLFEFRAESTANQSAAGRYDSLALVMSFPHCPTLRAWRETLSGDTLPPLGAARGILDFLEALHERKQVLGGLTADDFVIDESGRLCSMISDRVVPQHSSHSTGAVAGSRSAPVEARKAGRDAHRPPRPRQDLTAWALLTVALVTNFDQSGQRANSELSAAWDDKNARGRFEDALTRMAKSDPELFRALSLGRKQGKPQRVLAGWVAGVFHCLDPRPERRPKNVDQLREIADAWSPLSAVERFWNRFRTVRDRKQRLPSGTPTDSRRRTTQAVEPDAVDK